MNTTRGLVPLVLGGMALLLAGFSIGRVTGPDEPVEPQASDIGFAQDMTVHHEQAVRMSRTVRGKVSGPLDAIAAQIIETQVRETGMMRGWLSLWDAPQLASGDPMTWMSGEHSMDGSVMPGMATNAELDRLTAAEGRAKEVLFLQLMMRHHRGGVEMAAAGADLATLSSVRRAAQQMAAEQSQEIAVMASLLKERGGAELP